MIFAITFFCFTIFNTFIVSSAFVVSSVTRVDKPDYTGIIKQQQQQRTFTTTSICTITRRPLLKVPKGLYSKIMTTTSADNYNIRKVELQDVSGLKDVLDSSELFPSDYLDDMISDYFTNPDTDDIWFTTIDITNNNQPVAIGFCSLEKFTVGTYNLLAIAVQKIYNIKGLVHV